MSKKPFVAISVLFFSALIILACGETAGATSTAASGSSSSGSTTSSGSKHYKVGDVVKVGSLWEATINSFAVVPGDSFNTPKSGNQFVAFNVTLKNVAKDKLPVSSLISFKLKDATGQSYTQAIITTLKEAPNGDVQSGDNLRGDIGYEIPKAQKAFTLTFYGDALQSVSVVWDLSL